MRPRQDLHIHTHRSNCGKPENRVPAILKTAHQRGMDWIAFTDHIDEPQQEKKVAANLKKTRAEVLNQQTPVNVLVGAEASMLAPGECALSNTLASECDFVLVSCNHYHLSVVQKPVPITPSTLADWHLDMIQSALDMDFVDAIAHPFLNDYVDPELSQRTLSEYSEERLLKILEQGAERRVAFEINPYRVQRAQRWFYNLVMEGQRVGACFMLGSDAHQLSRVGFGERITAEYTPVRMLESIGLNKDDLITVQVPV